MKTLKKALVTGLVAVMMVVNLAGCGKFDAAAYVESCLDLLTKGETEQYMKMTGRSKEQAESDYESNIDAMMTEMDQFNLSDELSNSYRQLFKDVYAKAKYTVKDAEKMDDKDGYYVTVEIEQMTGLFNGIQEELMTEFTEWANSFVPQISVEDSLEQIRDKAVEEKQAYEKASEKYEELMTSPRADMGDSIKKAFRNVDDLLKELNLAVTEENRRAVRILGYNHQTIDEAHIAEVKEKDMLLTDVIKEMKPGKVLQMIRDGVNPVSMKLTDLDHYLKQQKDVAQEMESYSKFLYQLEKDKGIDEQERDAYIGIYRLLHQIEKNDHASLLGAMQADMELSLENLLTVMRSTKKKSINYKIDDDFGGVQQIDSGVQSITSQIEKGFQGDTADIQRILEQAVDEEAGKEFEQQIYEEARQAMHCEEAVLQQLESYHQPITPDHLMAMDLLLNASSTTYRKLKSLQKDSDLEQNAEKLLEKFTDRDSAQEAFSEFSEGVQKELEKEAFETPAGEVHSSLDMKMMSNLYKQVGFLQSLAKEENYEVPVLVDGTLTSINLKVIHDNEQESKVTITFSSELFGNVAAEFKYTEKGLNGYCTSTREEGSHILEEKEELFENELTKEGMTVDKIYFTRSRELNLKDFTSKQTKDRVDHSEISTKELYKTAKVFVGFIQKVSMKKGNNSYEN